MTNSVALTSLNEAIRDGKLRNLTHLAIQERTADHQLPVELTWTEKLCNLKTLYLRECVIFDVPMVTLSRLCKLSLYSCTGLTEVMSYLLCHQLHSLETLILRDCGLNAEDLSSLATASSDNRIKHLDISDNVTTLAEFMHQFDGSCTWNHLLSLQIQKTKCDVDVQDSQKTTIRTQRKTKVSGCREEDCKFIEYINDVVQQGKISSLKHLGMNCYQNTNTVWPKLERLSLLYCEEDSLSNIGDAVCSRFLPALHTVCIVRYDKYDARVTHRLSDMGVSCHEFSGPWDDPFYPGKCLCQKS